MKASGVMSLGKADGAGLMKSAGVGRARILLRSFCDPLSPDSLSELIASTFRSASASEKPGREMHLLLKLTSAPFPFSPQLILRL